MRALVTGGAGFIDSNLAGRPLQDGHEVVVLDDLPSGHRIILEPLRGSRFIEGDVRDPLAIDAAMAGAEVDALRPDVRHGPPRADDVRNSLADIDAARRAFGFAPSVGLVESRAEYLAWAREEVAQT